MGLCIPFKTKKEFRKWYANGIFKVIKVKVTLQKILPYLQRISKKMIKLKEQLRKVTVNAPTELIAMIPKLNRKMGLKLFRNEFLDNLFLIYTTINLNELITL